MYSTQNEGKAVFFLKFKTFFHNNNMVLSGYERTNQAYTNEKIKTEMFHRGTLKLSVFLLKNIFDLEKLKKDLEIFLKLAKFDKGSEEKIKNYIELLNSALDAILFAENKEEVLKYLH